MTKKGRKIKVNFDNLQEILISNLNKEKKPTKAVEKTLEDYNNLREEEDCICILTVWRYYKKMKKL